MLERNSTQRALSDISFPSLPPSIARGVSFAGLFVTLLGLPACKKNAPPAVASATHKELSTDASKASTIEPLEPTDSVKASVDEHKKAVAQSIVETPQAPEESATSKDTTAPNTERGPSIENQKAELSPEIVVLPFNINWKVGESLVGTMDRRGETFYRQMNKGAKKEVEDELQSTFTFKAEKIEYLPQQRFYNTEETGAFCVEGTVKVQKKDGSSTSEPFALYIFPDHVNGTVGRYDRAEGTRTALGTTLVLTSRADPDRQIVIDGLTK